MAGERAREAPLRGRGRGATDQPERVPGASDFAYVNINNMVATRDTFRQGIIESRLFLSALERVRIPASVVAACSGPTLPAGEDAFRFAPSPHAQGQSMGGMYTNLVTASDERIKLAVPTGAGGYWSLSSCGRTRSREWRASCHW